MDIKSKIKLINCREIFYNHFPELSGGELEYGRTVYSTDKQWFLLRSGNQFLLNGHGLVVYVASSLEVIIELFSADGSPGAYIAYGHDLICSKINENEVYSMAFPWIKQFSHITDRVDLDSAIDLYIREWFFEHHDPLGVFIQ